ncbi:MAG TPA: Pr6Pr family membrane protein [Methylocella sp.]|nr:Pr6Pr family membrane protein [Methylocella sp.]
MQGEVNASGATLKLFHLQRSGAAVIASMAWFAVAVQVYFNVEDALIRDESIASHLINFFSYFTVETNIFIAYVLTLFWLQPRAERFLTGPSVTSALVVYIIVVGVVYELLLRHLWHPHGMRRVADMMLHDAIPLLYSLYWLIFFPKGSLRWSDPANWLIYPILFFFYTMARGAAYGVYPYPFINADQLGLARVSVNATVFLAVFFSLGLGLTALDHALGSGERGRSGLGRAAEL